MTYSIRDHGAGARRRSGVLIVVVLLILGVAWMHTLAGAPTPSGRPGAAVVAAMVMGHCESGPHGMAGHEEPCPGTRHDGGHADAMCQSPALASTGLAAPTFSAREPVVSLPVSPALPATVAPDAAGGSGCGPPARTMLSIFRI